MKSDESSKKLLLTAVFGPYGVKNEYGEATGCQMELLNNQVTRCQGVHSPRQSYWSFGLYLMAENLEVPTTVLDFPSWDDFVEELRHGYTHVGISFIVPNVLKAERMAKYIREMYPDIIIILGGYGIGIPHLERIVPHDVICPGEGVRWLRTYFNEDVEAPVEHPALEWLAYEYIYGFPSKPKGSVLMPGLGCENGCVFCATSHKYEKRYVPLFQNGRELFQICERIEQEKRTRGFIIMDENFLKHPKRAKELLEEMERCGKPFSFDMFSSAEAIQALGVDFLVRLGVRTLWIGVESKRAKYDKTKGINLFSLISELQSKGIVVLASAILFFDYHDRKTIQEEIDWVISLKSSLVQFTNYTPLPGTTLFKQLEEDNRLNDVHYRHLHGLGPLSFEHPHFPESQEQLSILEQASLSKYREDGPGILNMALVCIRGYERLLVDIKEREARKVYWNPTKLIYEDNEHGKSDDFMAKRARMMRRVALRLRPLLVPALVFAPNAKARRKALEAMREYTRVLGKQTWGDSLRAAVLVASGLVEWLRIAMHKLRGREFIPRQPPCRRVKYRQG